MPFKMAGVPTRLDILEALQLDLVFQDFISRLHDTVCPLVRLVSVCFFFSDFLDFFGCFTAPAHQQATSAAVYTALFPSWLGPGFSLYSVLIFTHFFVATYTDDTYRNWKSCSWFIYAKGKIPSQKPIFRDVLMPDVYHGRRAPKN